MRILILNSNDTTGGAARAAYRLHQALLAEDVDSNMLVQVKMTDDPTVIEPSSKLKRRLAKIRPILDGLPLGLYKRREDTTFSVSWLPWSSLAARINALNPDLVHLHWICDGMIRIEEIAKIKAPIVWSLHDNWAFTGGCHVIWNCKKYQESCGACPRLGSSRERDISRRVWKRKLKTYSRGTAPAIICLSHWMAARVRESSLLGNANVEVLPNPIDVQKYKPFDKKQSRELWGLPQDKKLILFGAMHAGSDINKGFKELMEALILVPPDGAELVVFGNNRPIASSELRHKVIYTGKVHDDVSLRTLYSAADVIVVPSLQENLSNIIMEALACGLPVVCFDVGGNSDMVEHLNNGYLASPRDSHELAKGILWVINHDNYSRLSEAAVTKVCENFDSRVVAKRYIKLYEEILSRNFTKP